MNFRERKLWVDLGRWLMGPSTVGVGIRGGREIGM